MRRVLALASVVWLLALLPAGPATASGTGSAPDGFTFYGSGFGHGLGLSQWGAYGLAQQGWTPQRILTHFYLHTKIQQAKQVPASLRIGLVQGKAKIHLEAIAGGVDLRVGSRTPADTVATIPEGETWTVRPDGDAYRILDARGHPVGDPVGDASTNLYAIYEEQGARVKVPEAWHTYARGSIEFNLYRSGSAWVLRLVLQIDPERYLYGLAEVPSEWPVAALQTQAIAARTYALRKAAESGQHRSGCNCALYASSYDQVYAGWDKEAATDGDRWVRAVDATAGKVVTYQGETIGAFYMSSSGGYTENNENVWGGTPLPYLRGVCDPGDYTSANPSATWQVTVPAGKVTKALGLGIGTVTGFGNPVRGVSGRIISVTVLGQNGTASIDGDTLRAALGLRDDRVWINRNRQVVGTIRDKYDRMGCSPGLPSSAEVRVAGGLRQSFANAWIFSSDATGTYALSGDVLDLYRAKGGPAGKLGFPTSDVTRTASGGSRATFEHGVIACRPDGTCSIP